ncbi:MAG TPA: GGDEF domain-containing protein, partial [Thermoanaerobaculia bacterium]|nr:GGDEF domain-containing protein [Thermoanaerobaculia bacterium]
ARQSSAMFENARLFELATTDGLTGLPRRTIFEERLRLEIQRASRAFQPFGVGLADIDRFKAINDSHGHLVGDQALRMIADALSSEARSTDLVARYGGEEFALLLPHADHEGLIGLGEELRASVASTRVTAGDQVIPVTISIGLVWVGSPEQLTGAEDLIRRADEALYRAKAEGRNRVVTV